MSRSMTADALAEVGSARSRPCHLVKVQLGASYMYLTDAPRNIAYGGDTYLGVGYFLGFSDVEEFASLQISSLTLSLSGVDQVFIALFLNYDYIDREVSIYKAFLDNDGGLVSDPFLIFAGRLNNATIAEDPDDGTSTLAAEATSHWIDFERKPGRHTNHAEQMHWFPGDLGFEYASEIISDLYWGRIQ